MIPEEYGGLGESLLTYALVVEEIARGWMSVSGIINTHFIVAYMILQHGTDEQKQRYLPRMATGEVRGAFSMSEPGMGSDVAAIRSKAVRDGGSGCSPARRCGSPTAGRRTSWPCSCAPTSGERQPVQEHVRVPGREGVRLRGDGPGGHGMGKIDKMGYKGVDTTELVLEGHRTTDAQLLGGVAGRASTR